VFEVPTLDAAKRITLTTEVGMESEERWKLETPYLIDDIGKSLPIQSESWLLDYGCGPGRISKGLIDAHGCHATGIEEFRASRAESTAASVQVEKGG
jgi:cyclopropane fatty-acyl-phospholipid synthase-like methyltransferase